MKSFSKTRWWSRWEIFDQLCVHFGDLKVFLDENPAVAPKTIDHIRALLLDPVQKRHLQLELAAVIDIGQDFVRSAYDLEVVVRSYSLHS